MPIALTQYRVQSGERSNYAKEDGLINTVQGSLRSIGDQSKNGWGSGLILDPNQLTQDGATTGQALVWTSAGWVATTVAARSAFTVTSTIDIVNDGTEKDLFTGIAAGSTAGFLIPANGYDGIRVVAGGDYLNNTASGKKITLRLAAYDTSDATLKTMWQDISPALPNAATRRAWRLRVLIQPKPRPLSGIRRMASSGFFAMSDAAAPTTGLGKLLAPATTPLWAPFTSGYDPDTPPSTVASRLQFLLTHNAVDPNLSMRCLFARVEVTS